MMMMMFCFVLFLFLVWVFIGGEDFFVCLVLVCFIKKKREKERAWDWMDGEVGRIWEDWGKEKNDQNMLYKKISPVLIDWCIAQLSSENLYPTTDGNRDRDPQPDIRLN